jgi:hypothetical protein
VFEIFTLQKVLWRLETINASTKDEILFNKTKKVAKNELTYNFQMNLLIFHIIINFNFESLSKTH